MSQKGKRKCTTTTNTSTTTNTNTNEPLFPILHFDQNKQEMKLKTQSKILINNKTSSQEIKCDDEEKPFALIKLTDKSTKNEELFMLADSFKCQKKLLSNFKSDTDDLIERLNKSSSIFLAEEKLKSFIISFPLFKNVLATQNDSNDDSLILIKMGYEFFKLLSMIYQVQTIKTRQKTEKFDLPSNTIFKITQKKILKSTHHLHFISLDNGDDFILCSEIYKFLKIEQSMFHYQLKKFSTLKLYDGRLIFYKLKKLGVIHANTPSVTMMRFQDEIVQSFLESKSIKISPTFQETVYDGSINSDQAPITNERDKISASEPTETNETFAQTDDEDDLSKTEITEREESTETVLSDIIVSEDDEPPITPAKKKSKFNIDSLFGNVPICNHPKCDLVCDYKIKFVNDSDNTDLLFCKKHFPTILKLKYNLQIQTKTVDLTNF